MNNDGAIRPDKNENSTRADRPSNHSLTSRGAPSFVFTLSPFLTIGESSQSADINGYAKSAFFSAINLEWLSADYYLNVRFEIYKYWKLQGWVSNWKKGLTKKKNLAASKVRRKFSSSDFKIIALSRRGRFCAVEKSPLAPSKPEKQTTIDGQQLPPDRRFREGLDGPGFHIFFLTSRTFDAFI